MSEKSNKTSGISRRNRSLMRRQNGVFQDLWASLRLIHLWRALAWEDLMQRFRRSILGLSWIVVSFALLIFILVVLFGRNSPTRTTYEYLVYLCLGMAIWTYLSAIVSKGVMAFAGNSAWIKSTPAPFGVLAFRTIYAGILELLVLLVFVVPISLYLVVPDPIHLLYLLGAIGVYAINSVSICLLLGSLGAWSSDVQQLIPAIMRIAFFATPIFWEYETSSGLRRYMADYNPFTHFVEIIRAPLMGTDPSQINWMVVGFITTVSMILSFAIFKFARTRLPVWV